MLLYYLIIFLNNCILFQAELEARIEKRKVRFGEVKPTNKKVFYNKVKIVK